MKTIIIGGGPSGLGVAWGLVEAGYRDVILVEKNTRLGGLSGSFQLGDITFDYGPHRFSPEYPELVEKIKTLMGPELLEVPNTHAVYFLNRAYRYPPSVSDFLNLQTVTTATHVLLSWFYQRIKEICGACAGKKTNYDQFETIVIHRFGFAFYQKVIRPMCLKIWGEPNTLDPSFANLRFSIPTFTQWYKKLVGHSDTFNDKVFYYPRLGFQQLWDFLGEHLKTNGVQIRCNATVSSINMEGRRAAKATITQNGKTEEIECDWVVSTIPTQHFVRTLSPNPFSSAELLGHKFVNRGIILIAIVVKGSPTLPARVVIFPEAKYSFNRLSEQNQFSSDTVPGGRSAILADIIADVNSATWHKEDIAIKSEVIDQILSCNFFSKEEIVESHLFRIPIAYPLPTAERENSQTKFNKTLLDFDNIICTGRFASSDYNNSHTALKKGILAAEVIIGKQRLGDWYQSAEEIRKTAIRD